MTCQRQTCWNAECVIVLLLLMLVTPGMSEARKLESGHWSYQPISRPVPPAFREPESGIDAFVRQRLRQEKITPSPEAEGATQIRRVTLDLIGLPPTPEEVDAFLADERPDAYPCLVDRLLASPRYGERWARPWLDLCHYADTDGYLTTYNGKDNSHLRFQELTHGSIELKVEEDTAEDTEIAHAAAESVAYLAIGGQGLLTAIDTTVTDGNSQSFQLDVNATGRVHDLNVIIELVHGHLEDLDIAIESPTGTLVELLSDMGGTGNRLTGTTLDDEAAQSITSGVVPFAGYFQPEGLLRDISGQDAAGRWTLHVTDDTVNGEEGTLAGWSLDIKLVDDAEGNLNHDGDVNTEDIDLLFANLGSVDPTFDVDHDGNTDRSDIDTLVLNIMEKRFEDTNLDQDVDIHDFDTTVVNFDPQGQNVFNSWSQGNSDGDDDVDIADVVKLVLSFAPSEYTPVSVPLWTASEVARGGVGTLVLLSSGGDEDLSATAASSSAQNHPRHTLSNQARPPVMDRKTTVEENLIVDEYFRSSVWRMSDFSPRSQTQKSAEHESLSSLWTNAL